ncbi:MAG: hypothetical protein HOV80_09165 [Polyangiaceae bacterium]|nr:hypothetical protein [Polyangiaceae bacterium]
MTKARRRLGLGALVFTGLLTCTACESPEKAQPSSAPTQAASAPTASAAPAGAGGANQTGSSTTATGMVEAP